MELKLPELSDALKPLPRLKSLVITELENIGRKTPIDRKVFSIAFFGIFAFLATLALAIPFVLKQKPVEGVAPVLVAEPTQPPTDVQKRAMDANDANWHAPLPWEPNQDLLDAATGAPVISADGRHPWKAYARPYDRHDVRPRIIVVVMELGQLQQLSQSAISDLPGPVSLGFSSLSSEPDAWMERARQRGHEVLLSIPMEPLDYPASDPGSGTLLTRNTSQENNALLHGHLTHGKGYVGVTSLSGSRMNTTQDKLKPILEELKRRGLMWLDANLSPLSAGDSIVKEINLPSVKADRHIHDDMSATAIRQVLNDAQAIAGKNGHSVVLVQATPLAISVIRDWATSLPATHISLAPLSSLVE